MCPRIIPADGCRAFVIIHLPRREASTKYNRVQGDPVYCILNTTDTLTQGGQLYEQRTPVRREVMTPCLVSQSMQSSDFSIPRSVFCISLLHVTLPSNPSAPVTEIMLSCQFSLANVIKKCLVRVRGQSILVACAWSLLVAETRW